MIPYDRQAWSANWGSVASLSPTHWYFTAQLNRNSGTMKKKVHWKERRLT